MNLKRPALALHGGCGALLEQRRNAALAADYRTALASALDTGWRVLAGGGTALDAVEATVAELEDCPLFNAGCGSVFHAEGGHELDAAIMCGEARRAGAVSGLRTIANPVRAARAVLEDGRFVYLTGNGGEAFAAECGLRVVEPAYFDTDYRKRQLVAARGSGTVVMDHDMPLDGPDKFGTVGAVACDWRGGLAAATSTGGLTNKLPGRVGDTPVIGAGTYADSRYAAISCTGNGEEFLRGVVAYDVIARMRYGRSDLVSAASDALEAVVSEINGDGGLIAVDAAGTMAMPFSPEGMPRAWRCGQGPAEVRLFRES